MDFDEYDDEPAPAAKGDIYALDTQLIRPRFEHDEASGESVVTAVECVEVPFDISCKMVEFDDLELFGTDFEILDCDAYVRWLGFSVQDEAGGFPLQHGGVYEVLAVHCGRIIIALNADYVFGWCEPADFEPVTSRVHAENTTIH